MDQAPQQIETESLIGSEALGLEGRQQLRRLLIGLLLDEDASMQEIDLNPLVRTGVRRRVANSSRLSRSRRRTLQQEGKRDIEPPGENRQSLERRADLAPLDSRDI